MGSADSAAMLCLVFFFFLGCSSAQNNLGDPCTNECQPGNPLAWCGKRRFDPAGRVVRCVQGTKYGLECVDSCTAKNESYFWCWTNAQNVVADYWEKCGTSKGDQSYTVKGVPCQSGCEMKRKSLTEYYWWCSDNDQDPSSWDYCSPPGQVRPLQYTMHGHACLGLCDQHGENYWCCTASSWDYCSPEPDIVQETRTKSGFLCNGICDKMSSSYFFCEMKMTTGWSWWDYCTKN